MKNLGKFYGSFEELIELLKAEGFEEYGSITYQKEQNNEILLLGTGGWADNEKMLYQLSLSLFHYIYWLADLRGGKTIYSTNIENLQDLYKTIAKMLKKRSTRNDL